MVTIDAFMSSPVVAIGHTASLAEAAERMAAARVRHLLVLEHGRPVGVLSLEDLFRLESVKHLVHPEVLPVFEAMSPEPYEVPSGSRLAEVAAHMVEQRIGSAVVVSQGQVIGLFTATDALRAIAKLAP